MMAKLEDSSSYGVSDIPSLKKDDDSIDDLPLAGKSKQKSSSNYDEDDYDSSSQKIKNPQ